MDLAEAENAALTARRKTPVSGRRVANVGQPRDPVTEWEDRVAAQFKALAQFAKSRGCYLTAADLPPRAFGKSGQEHETYHATGALRYWKSTFPGQSGFGPFGYQTPGGYLRRLRLSNLIFGDDVAFEGILRRREGLSIVTSQSYIQPHPVRFIPTEAEIQALLGGMGFAYDESAALWCRSDGVQLGDTHNRNFIRAPDESIIAIDVQPRLLAGHAMEDVRPPA
jgi:Serine/Threonine/Tyrosine Kinase found in polyvalent proteins